MINISPKRQTTFRISPLAQKILTKESIEFELDDNNERDLDDESSIGNPTIISKCWWAAGLQLKNEFLQVYILKIYKTGHFRT